MEFLSIVIVLLIFVILYSIFKSYFFRKPNRTISSRHVVVTGGSSGIGLCIAIRCVKLGANVTIIARQKDTLEKALQLLLANQVNDKQKIQYRSLDLSTDYNVVTRVLDDLEHEIGPIYMLVNCAGGAVCGVMEDMSIEDVRLMMDINYYATVYPTKHILSKFKAANEGIIVITASQAALVGIYGLSAYNAAKFALRGFAETIAMETSHTNVTITLALPADTDTPGFKNEQKSKPLITKIISESGGLSKPEDVGMKIVDDALSGTFISIFGFESWLLTLFCSGMAPWGSITFNVFQAILLSPLKLVCMAIQWNFRRVIKNNLRLNHNQM